jgi:hypothetical protein
MGLAGLEPATSWVRSSEAAGGFGVERSRLAGHLRGALCGQIRADVCGLSTIISVSGTLGDKCLKRLSARRAC